MNQYFCVFFMSLGTMTAEANQILGTSFLKPRSFGSIPPAPAPSPCVFLFLFFFHHVKYQLVKPQRWTRSPLPHRVDFIIRSHSPPDRLPLCPPLWLWGPHYCGFKWRVFIQAEMGDATRHQSCYQVLLSGQVTGVQSGNAELMAETSGWHQRWPPHSQPWKG